MLESSFGKHVVVRDVFIPKKKDVKGKIFLLLEFGMLSNLTKPLLVLKALLMKIRY